VIIAVPLVDLDAYCTHSTATDSNTRERLPYEGDALITGHSRLSLQREFAWPRHSFRHNIENPTNPTEWRQTAALLALLDYEHTGSLELFEQFAEVCCTSKFTYVRPQISNALAFRY
jgi:hypothetical protein